MAEFPDPDSWFRDSVEVGKRIREAVGAFRPADFVFFQVADPAGNVAWCEASIPALAWRVIPDEKTMSDRQYVLNKAGVKWFSWDGLVENAAAFGRQVNAWGAP